MILQVQAGSIKKWLTMLCKLYIATNDTTQRPIDILVIAHALQLYWTYQFQDSAGSVPQFYLGVFSPERSFKLYYSQIIIFYIELLYSVSLCWLIHILN